MTFSIVIVAAAATAVQGGQFCKRIDQEKSICVYNCGGGLKLIDFVVE